MGFAKERRPVLSPGGQIRASGAATAPAVGDFVQAESLTSSTALQTLSAHGVSFLTASTGGGGRDFRLPAPPGAGARKVIFVDQSGSTAPEVVRIVANTTAAVFFGTTFNEVACAGSTVQPAGSAALLCIGVNSTTWAVSAVGSTGIWDFAASTGSTGQ